jgi:uncharacterized protein YceH (UPF0502 family)
VELPRLNAHEARILGVLIEKDLTTPDQYPLSLNAATNGANQKSNRDPVVSYLEAEVVVALQGLTIKGLAGRVQGSGSRVEKYRHNGRERLGLDEAGLAIVAELLMRGAQAPGELRARASRMSPLASLEELERHLAALAEKGLVQRLAPAPGSRAERWTQCIAADPSSGAGSSAALPEALPGAVPRPSGAPPSAAPRVAAANPASNDLPARVTALEGAVAELRSQLTRLAGELGARVE